MNAARKIMAHKGIFDTRAEEIARAAKVSPGLIFQYFPSLRALRDAVLADGQAPRTRPLPGALSELSPTAALEAIGLHFVSIFDDDPDWFRLMLFCVLSGRPFPVRTGRLHLLLVNRRLRALISGWQRRGYVRGAIEADEAARLFTSALLSTVLEETVFGRRRGRDAVQAAVTAFSALLGANSGTGTRETSRLPGGRSMRAAPSERRDGRSARFVRSKKG